MRVEISRLGASLVAKNCTTITTRILDSPGRFRSRSTRIDMGWVYISLMRKIDKEGQEDSAKDAVLGDIRPVADEKDA